MIVAVDLAAKYSAACVMDSRGAVLEEQCSWGLTEDEFIEWIVRPWLKHKHTSVAPGMYEKPDVLIVEDLPHKLPFMTLTKKVSRMQGRIADRMQQMGFIDDLIFLPPALWLRSYGIKTVKDAAKLVQPKAEELGYTVPLDYTQYKGKDRQTARKVNTDFSAAYLIGLWATNYFKEHETYDAPGTQRYE